MKKLILASIFAMGLFAADAQTTKSKSKKKAKKTYMSSEAKAKAREKAEVARIAKLTETRIEEFRVASLLADSMRLDSERVARDSFEIQRQAYIATKLSERDSLNKATYAKLSAEKELAAKTEHNLDAVNKAANLGSYQSRQVKIINQTYYDKARLVKENTELTDDARKQQLAALNTERRAKIKAVLGSAKEKKLEKERKEYVKKYGVDPQATWIDEVEGYASNK
jgi:hypothetical protein